jgi:serine/threonine-protein kinase
MAGKRCGSGSDGEGQADPAHPLPAQSTIMDPAPAPEQSAASANTRASLPPAAHDSDALLVDRLLIGTTRIEYQGVLVPSFGGIALIAKIGQGGMGAVYRGVKPLLRQEVAVKVLPMHLATLQPSLVERFIREAQIAASIESPHLVRVTDVNEENGVFYLVMEFVRGTSAGGHLKHLARQGRCLDEATALDICIGAAEGLAAAHRHGVIHRDVKPDNILLPFAREGGEIQFALAKLADLGLARSEEMGEGITGTSLGMGTPGYMAPEQAVSARRAGKPADVFGLAATLYALLTGHAPFRGETSAAIMMATIQNPHEPIRTLRPDVSPATGTLLDHCLEKEPHKRYVDASALLQALKVCRAALDTGESKSALIELTQLREAQEIGEPARRSSAPGISADARPLTPFPSSARAAFPAALRNPKRAIAITLGLSAVLIAITLWAVGRPAPGSRSGFLARLLSSSGATAPVAETVSIRVVHSTDKAEWYGWAAAEFAKTEKGVAIVLEPADTAQARARVLEGGTGGTRVQAWAGASQLYRDILESDFKAKFGRSAIVRSVPVSLTPEVIVVFEDRYQALVKTLKRVDFTTLREATLAKRGWGEIAGRPEWGRVTFGLGDPRQHASGLVAAILLGAEFFHTDAALTPAQASDPRFREWTRAFHDALAVKENNRGIMNDMVLRGPSAYDAALVYESDAVMMLKNLQDRWGPARVIYPGINFWNESRYEIVEGSTDEQKKAAEDFRDFLLSIPAQEKLATYGFRPANPQARLHFDGSPFTRLKDMGMSLAVPIAAAAPSAEVVKLLTELAE